jgi:HlyD family secretion protein
VAASLQAPVLFTLAEDLTQMELHVDVDEADVGQVVQGQGATFTVDAYPGRTFPAKTTQVRYGSQTTDGVVTYKTVLKVDNSDLLLRPGMTATADIVVRKVENAILVPNAALRFIPPVANVKSDSSSDKRSMISRLFPRPSHGNRSSSSNGRRMAGEQPQQIVWTLKDGELTPISITTGATDGIVTEVTSGEIEPGTVLVVDSADVG